MACCQFPIPGNMQYRYYESTFTLTLLMEWRFPRHCLITALSLLLITLIEETPKTVDGAIVKQYFLNLCHVYIELALFFFFFFKMSLQDALPKKKVVHWINYGHPNRIKVR